MKKIIMTLAVAAVAVSCKKISAGGNEGRLKLEDGVERYSDDPQGTVLKRDTTAEAAPIANTADSTVKKLEAVPAKTNGKETTVNTMSAPVNNAKTDSK